MEQLTKQPCPICQKNTLTLMEDEQEVPFFGKLAIFSMICSDCGFKKSDIEALAQQEPAKFSIEIDSEEDLKIRVVKSSEATVKIPHIITMEPGPASNGYITNVEGLLERAKDAVQTMRDSDEDPTVQKKCKNMLKKIQRVLWGRDKVKITIEDPSGNSAIISDKAIKSKLKK
ncbi:ZPR1 zinc finger domain-containing protein [Candidatus Woesearchaeota archaeon]|jgi:zinc finger protein|nr:ZPR1 zinc finger domain-containing protein [Candidatus Woesearchaeota archaeon]MBT4368510.1 ZPR1 zinc finger domain-containing protein [Candidatus Woesearchaeota archaeon]MBT4712999.1 ZPR1 zinc finger domain-containing protein [Candidatus Woesearchaeota archaeon]MBT6639911.1 ZPR1 zinc finger domain-containing protein [Candidatus Woesearchaeota archaeon]MBT7134083.1 ZPR1 zinc finger domain-containing protein [Candidatus Woesearchaeota archaeon]